MGLREKKKSDTRQRILHACGQLFRARGFDDTTIADITAAAEVSRQTFFNYFSGKEAVLTELGLAWLREQAEAPRIGPRSERRGSVLSGTREAIRAQLRAIEADPDFMRLVFTRSGLLFPQGPSGAPGAERARDDHVRRLFDGLAMVMRAAQEAGEVRPGVDPVQAAEMYVSLMLMTIRFWLVDYWQDGVGLEARAMRALDVLESGLSTPRREAP